METVIGANFFQKITEKFRHRFVNPRPSPPITLRTAKIKGFRAISGGENQRSKEPARLGSQEPKKSEVWNTLEYTPVNQPNKSVKPESLPLLFVDIISRLNRTFAVNRFHIYNIDISYYR
jgi:hypothetical protein